MAQNEIRFTTSSEEVFEAVSRMSLDGVEVTGSITFDDASLDLPTLIIGFSSGVAVNVFSSWLYDLLKKHAGAKPRINGQTVETSTQAINVFITKSTNINIQIAQKSGGENANEP